MMVDVTLTQWWWIVEVGKLMLLVTKGFLEKSRWICWPSGKQSVTRSRQPHDPTEGRILHRSNAPQVIPWSCIRWIRVQHTCQFSPMRSSTRLAAPSMKRSCRILSWLSCWVLSQAFLIHRSKAWCLAFITSIFCAIALMMVLVDSGPVDSGASLEDMT